jgi:hypothetical protein
MNDGKEKFYESQKSGQSEKLLNSLIVPEITACGMIKTIILEKTRFFQDGNVTIVAGCPHLVKRTESRAFSMTFHKQEVNFH